MGLLYKITPVGMEKMIDIRYHIYSLAAVFFALAIGIVIGTSFAKGSPVAQSEKVTIQSYENNMRILKREIELASEDVEQKKEQLKNSEEFCGMVLPIIAKDKLVWRNVAIIQTGDYDELAGSIKRAIEMAGARVTSVTEINRSFPFEDNKEIAQAIAEFGIPQPEDSIRVRDRLWKIIANNICMPGDMHTLSVLEKSEVAKFTGDYERANRLIVLVGGASSIRGNTASIIDSQLIVQLGRPGVTVVACEGTNAASSYITAWDKTGIATIDNADSAIGQFSLICSLNGERAKFGVKKTAEKLAPQILEGK